MFTHKMDNNHLANIFLTTFSILYGIMLNASFQLALFHFGWLWKNERDFPYWRKQEKVLNRVFVSIIIFNVLPFAYFAWMYNVILKNNFQLQSMWQIFGVCLLSLSVFFYYRLYHLLLAFPCVRDWLYDLEHPALCNFKKNRLKAMGHSKWGQSIATFFYLSLIIIGLWFVRNPFPVKSIIIFFDP